MILFNNLMIHAHFRSWFISYNGMCLRDLNAGNTRVRCLYQVPAIIKNHYKHDSTLLISSPSRWHDKPHTVMYTLQLSYRSFGDVIRCAESECAHLLQFSVKIYEIMHPRIMRTRRCIGIIRHNEWTLHLGIRCTSPFSIESNTLHARKFIWRAEFRFSEVRPTSLLCS